MTFCAYAEVSVWAPVISAVAVEASLAEGIGWSASGDEATRRVASDDVALGRHFGGRVGVLVAPDQIWAFWTTEHALSGGETDPIGTGDQEGLPS